MAAYEEIDTPVDRLFVGASEQGLHIIKFLDQRESEAELIAELEAAEATAEEID